MLSRLLFPRLLALLLLALLGPGAALHLPAKDLPDSSAAPPDSKLLTESWAIINLQGKRVGFSSAFSYERDTPEGKQYVTKIYEQIAIKRMGDTIKMINNSIITEDEQGGIVNFESVTEGFGTYKKTRGYRVGDEMVIMSGNIKRTHPFPKDALGPHATDQAMRKMPLQPGASTSLKTFMPDSPTKAVTETFTVKDKTNVTIEGTSRRLWELSSQISILPGLTSEVFLNDDYEVQMVKLTLPLIGTLEVVSTERAKAMERIEAAEVFSKTLIQPNRPIPNYRKLKRAQFKLQTNPPNKDLPIYEGEGQRVIARNDDGSVVVETTVPVLKASDAAFNLPAASTPELEKYLRESAYLEQNDLIKQLSQQAVGEETNPLKAAEKIDLFVRRYIKRKNLGVGFASAAETAANKQGDCTEHAVLCAALGRAAGLPTRVVSGFGYLPMDYAGNGDPNLGTFGFHMWAEAYIAPGKWAPMDAALGDFTVCHIAIDKSDLDETNPFVELSVPILELLHSLKIDVLETE